MADLAPAGAAQELHLADGERREVVVEKELLTALALVLLDDLSVALGAERGRYQGLGLAAGEERRTVGAGQQPGFHGQVADLVQLAAVEAALGGEHGLAKDLLLHSLDRRARLGAALFVVLGDRFDVGIDDTGDRLLALELALDVQGIAERLPEIGAEAGVGLFAERLGALEGALLHTGLGLHLTLGADDLAQLLVAAEDGLQDPRLGQLVGCRLDHHNRLVRADDDQVEIRNVTLAIGRVEDQLALDEADANSTHRVMEGDVGQRQRRRGAVDGEDVGVVLTVGGQHQRDDLGLVAKTLREQRPQRPIGHPAGEDLLLRRSALTLEEAAGDSPAGIGVLAVVDRQGQEVPRTRASDHAGGAQDHRVAAAHDA